LDKLDIIDGDDDDGDEDPDPSNSKNKKRKDKTPIKASWLVPIVKDHIDIAEQPNISNNESFHLLKLYVKDVFLTEALLHNTRTTSLFEVFGHPDVNVKCVGQLKHHMEDCGHDAELVKNTPPHPRQTSLR
jgi:hypothetical protein